MSDSLNSLIKGVVWGSIIIGDGKGDARSIDSGYMPVSQNRGTPIHTTFIYRDP